LAQVLKHCSFGLVRSCTHTAATRAMQSVLLRNKVTEDKLCGPHAQPFLFHGHYWDDQEWNLRVRQQDIIALAYWQQDIIELVNVRTGHLLAEEGADNLKMVEDGASARRCTRWKLDFAPGHCGTHCIKLTSLASRRVLAQSSEDGRLCTWPDLGYDDQLWQICAPPLGQVRQVIYRSSGLITVDIGMPVNPAASLEELGPADSVPNAEETTLRVWITGLTYQYILTEEDVHTVFARYGAVVQVTVDEACRSALVTYDEAQDAQRAINDLNGKLLDGLNATLRVGWASQETSQEIGLIDKRVPGWLQEDPCACGILVGEDALLPLHPQHLGSMAIHCCFDEIHHAEPAREAEQQRDEHQDEQGEEHEKASSSTRRNKRKPHHRTRLRKKRFYDRLPGTASED